jgi:hypothetical protein
MANDNLQPQSEGGDNSSYLIPVERVDNAILEIRGQKVILSRDLASLYGVSTRRLNEQVKRNIGRFPPDFMFQLSWEETQNLRSESDVADGGGLRSQFATLERGKHHKYRPYAFTEHGAVMAATILNTSRAIEVSVFVVRAFVRLSRVAANYRQLALRLGELEAKFASHDKNFRVVFDALRKLMRPREPEPKKRHIGFGPDDNRTGSNSDFIARDRPAKPRNRKP